MGDFLAAPGSLAPDDSGETAGVFAAAVGGLPLDDFLSQLDGKLRSRNEDISQRSAAWGDLLELAGWCVALEMPGGTPWLNGLAMRHLDYMEKTAATWDELLKILEMLPDRTVHRQIGGVLIWTAAISEESETARKEPLTRRESEVMEWLRQGKTSPEISIILGCSTRTIEKHVANLYRKIGVRDRTAAILSSN